MLAEHVSPDFRKHTKYIVRGVYVIPARATRRDPHGDTSVGNIAQQRERQVLGPRWVLFSPPFLSTSLRTFSGFLETYLAGDIWTHCPPLTGIISLVHPLLLKKLSSRLHDVISPLDSTSG